MLKSAWKAFKDGAIWLPWDHIWNISSILAVPPPLCLFLKTFFFSSTPLNDAGRGDFFHEWTGANSPTIILEKAETSHRHTVTQAQILTEKKTGDTQTFDALNHRWEFGKILNEHNLFFTTTQQMPIIFVCISCLTKKRDSSLFDIFFYDRSSCLSNNNALLSLIGEKRVFTNPMGK